MIRERLQRAKAAKKRLGRHVHGRIPYGYRSTDGILQPDPETAPIVQRIIAEVREGSSPGRVAHDKPRRRHSRSPRNAGRATEPPPTRAPGW